MADLRVAIYSIDEGGGGSISWPPLLQVCASVARVQCMPGDLLAALSDRLKSEATYVVLNTLTALHTICLNAKQPVHDQLAGSKVLKYLERLLNKPPFPGVEMAAAQLLMDWAFLYGQEELGHRSFAALTSTSKHRAMLQAMAASDAAVILKEDQKLGLPQFCSVVRGLDFQRHFSTQLAPPLTSNAAPPGVATQLAKAAVAASYSDSAAAAAAAAASRNTFAAWAERVQQDPQAAAQKVLDSNSHVQVDLDTLQAAQEACVAAARDYSNSNPQQQQQPRIPSNSSSSSSKAATDVGLAQLRHQLDKAYLAACKVGEWREMTEVLVQQRLPDTQLSALLSLADKINSVLDSWQQAATTEVFWLLGVNTAGLADGSMLAHTVAAATAAAGSGATTTPPAAAAAAGVGTSVAAAATAGGGGSGAASNPLVQQQQQQLARQPGSLTRGSSSYLDLLTGDTAPALSTNNPFLTSSSSATAGVVNTSRGHAIGQTLSAPVATVGRAGGSTTAAAAGGSTAAPPDELQRYLQELGVGAAVASSGSGNAVGVQQVHLPSRSQSHPIPSPQPQQHYVAHMQQQQQYYPKQQQQQPQHYPAVHGVGRTSSSSSTSSSAWAGRPAGATPSAAAYTGGGFTATPAVNGINSTSSSTGGPSSTGSAAAAAAVIAASSAAAAAAASAGDSGSSSGDSSAKGSAAVCSYTNPFAALDTNTIMKGLKGSSAAAAGSAGRSNAATAVVTTTGGGGSGGGECRSSMDGSQVPSGALTALTPALAPHHHQHAHHHQQQHSAQVAQLQAKVQQLLSTGVVASTATSSSSSSGAQQHCQTCSLPSRPSLEAGVMRLLLEQQQQHEVALQHLQQQHQQQVADIKAMAVQRFKELQQQLAAAHQQLQ